MQFDLVDLRLFHAVATAASITRAAQAMHLSLPAASARIKALEGQAGMQLLVREARGVRLTPAGEAFLTHARAMLRQTEELRSDLSDYARGLRGVVRVFANTTAATDILPEILPAFLQAHPKVSVELRETHNAEIALAVREGRADVGIVSDRMDSFGLQAIHFSTDRLVLVTARGHAFAGRRSIAFAETLDEDHVGMHGGSTLHGFLSEVAETLGRRLRLRVQLSSFDAVCRMIAAGAGVGVVPASSAQRSLAALDIATVELQDPWRVRERYAMVRDGEPVPAYARALIEALVEFGAATRDRPLDSPHPRKAG
jgi:DNA-binding transcriptional LysR family regulator